MRTLFVLLDITIFPFVQDNPRIPEYGSRKNTSDTHKVVIVIQDVQDLPPAFAFLPLSFNMPENQTLVSQNHEQD